MPAPELIKALADLIWPILALIAVLSLRRPLRALVESVGSRGGGVEVGGFKITVSEAASQQQAQIADLQRQVGRLSELVKSDQAIPSDFGGVIDLRSEKGQDVARVRSILWVDDHPENNAMLQSSFKELGFDIINALSTKQAQVILQTKDFEAIVSDIGRGIDRQAGIELVRTLRSAGDDTPVLIYTSADAVSRFGDMARAAGANFVTASPTELLTVLKAVGQ